MKSFLLRLFFITIVLLFGILLGIYQSQGPHFSHKIDVSKNESKSVQYEQSNSVEKVVEVTTLPDEIGEEKSESADLVAKQEKADAVNAFNFYSDLGATIGDLFHRAFSSLISTLIGTIHSLLHPQ